MKQYAIIQDTGSYIQCLGVYPLYEGIGHLIVEAENACRCWKQNGYTLTDTDEFFKLELDNGYGWEWNFKDDTGNGIYERWYLLEVPDYKGDRQ